MTAAKTPWFDGTVKPVRVGMYERLYNVGPMRDLWTGHMWQYPAGGYCIEQTRCWRGLASDPAKAKK